MDYCALLSATIEKAPEGVWKEMLKIVAAHSGCDDDGGVVTPQGGGGGVTNPPAPPPKPQ